MRRTIALFATCLSISAFAGDVPPEWYGSAAAMRIMQGFSGGSNIVLKNQYEAATQDGSVQYSVSKDNPCVIAALRPNHSVGYQIVLSKLKAPWTVKTYPFNSGYDYVEIEAGAGGACKLFKSGQQECVRVLRLPSFGGATERALEYLAGHGCEFAPATPF